MRIRNVKNADIIVGESKYVINNPKDNKNKWHKTFNNTNPISLEIGMGKGDFIIDMATKNPNINFIGVEKYTSIVAKALKKLDEINLPNLKIINIDAKELNDIFDKEIKTIYLNFSDPWPKKRHARRRLTSSDFLKIYDDIFIDKKEIIQKTDNLGLFASSIVSLSEYGYTIKEVSLDLANEDIKTSETEYERKFKSQGVKINYLKAIKD